MALTKNLYFVGLVAISINLFGCGDAMSIVIESEELEKKWNESIMNSSESWWYAGTKNSHHYIVIKRSYSSKTYQVDEKKVEIVDIERFDYTKTEDEWVNMKVGNINFLHANLDR